MTGMRVEESLRSHAEVSVSIGKLGPHTHQHNTHNKYPPHVFDPPYGTRGEPAAIPTLP